HSGEAHYAKLGPGNLGDWSFGAADRQFPAALKPSNVLFRIKAIFRKDTPDDNAISQSVVLYQQLVDTLEQLLTPTGSSSTRLNTQLANTAGAFAHYVADLHQPFHATHYSTWFLKYPNPELAYQTEKPRPVPGEYNAHRHFEKGIRTEG